MNWQQLITYKRLGQELRHLERYDGRTEFKRDYDRLIFSAPFRRLQNKTQVFPLPGSVFVHNRLTHSLEVASVGMSLGNDVAKELTLRHPELSNSMISQIGQIVATACLAHDMGNPPFGHSGEKAIQTFFTEGAGSQLKSMVSREFWSDITHFEGNANAFRLLTHHFKGRREGGFVMTYSTLASIVKYPFSSDLAGDKRKFGFFREEQQYYTRIADELGIICHSTSEGSFSYARYPLVYLVEAADDICYQIMDIEDAHKLKILTTQETKQLLLGFFPDDKKTYFLERMSKLDDANEQIVFLRSCVINCLENECVNVFVEHEEEILSGTFAGTLIGHIAPLPRNAYQTCAHTAETEIYHCKEVVDVEIAGFKVITELVDMMIHAALHSNQAFSQLLINRVSTQYDIKAPTLYGRVMAVLDYISGMTDVYALDVYRKTNGMSIPSL